jgi:hypothetical protein
MAELRNRRVLSQRDLAALINTAQPTLVSLERHRKGRVAVLNAELVLLGAGLTLARRGNLLIRPGWKHLDLSRLPPRELLRLFYKDFGTFDLNPCSPTAN